MIGMILSSVCPSVCDTVSCGYTIHPAAKVIKQVNRKCPLEQDFTTFNPLHWHYPLKLPTRKIYSFIISCFVDCVSICFILMWKSFSDVEHVVIEVMAISYFPATAGLLDL